MANQTNNTQDVNSSKIDAGALVQAGIGGAGALSTAYSIYGNVKSKEDLMGRINSMYDAPYRGTDSFDSLTQSYLNYSPYRNFTMDEIGFNKGAAGMNVASTAMQGAGAGAAFGPWGALVGGLAGLGAGLFGFGAAKRKARKTLNFANSKISEVNKYNLSGLDNRLSNAQREQFGNLKLNSGYALRGAYGGPLGVIEGPIDYSMAMQYLDMKNNAIQNKLMADGGQLHSHGSDWNTGLNYVGNGGSHEENPYDGVPMGIAPDGQPNLVEEGEVIWNNDYVFSKRLKVPKAIRNKYKLRGNKPLSFADAALQFNKEMEERPNDPISKRGRDSMLAKLADVQEEKRADIAFKEQQEDMLQGIQPMIAANGGAIHIDKNKRGTFTAAASRHGKSVQEFASQVLANPENYSPAMRKKANFARNAAKWHSDGGHLYADAGWLDNYANWWNSRRNFNTNLANSAIERLDNARPELNTLYEVPGLLYTDFPTEVWNRSIKYDADGKNLSKDVMNWFAKQAELMHSSNFEFKNVPRTKAFYDDWTKFINGLDEQTVGDGTLVDRVERILAKANKGPVGNISKGIQQLYDTYGKTGNDARMDSHIIVQSPRILPQTLLNPTILTNPTSKYPILNAANNLNTTIQNSETQSPASNSGSNRTGSSWLTGLRYAPVLGSALGVFSDLMGWTNKPDYSQADAIARAARGMGTISASPIGDYLTYRPMDRMFALNMLNANAGANRRAILDTTGGNRGTAMAGLLASDNNTLNNIGNLFRQAEEYNAQQREKVATFNRATNMYNSELDFNAQKANLGRDEVVMRGLQAAAAMRDAIDQRVGTARSINLTNLFESLGDIGREAAIRNMINSNPAWMYDIGWDGIVDYTRKSNGGKIKNKKGKK